MCPSNPITQGFPNWQVRAGIGESVVAKSGKEVLEVEGRARIPVSVLSSIQVAYGEVPSFALLISWRVLRDDLRGRG